MVSRVGALSLGFSNHAVGGASGATEARTATCSAASTPTDICPCEDSSSETWTPYFFSASLIRPLILSSSSGEYLAAFLGMLMQLHAARQVSPESSGYRLMPSSW